MMPNDNTDRNQIKHLLNACSFPKIQVHVEIAITCHFKKVHTSHSSCNMKKLTGLYPQCLQRFRTHCNEKAC